MLATQRMKKVFGSTPTIPLCQETSPDPTTPQEWLMLATQRMKKVLPPIQSNFRVYAILTWKDSTNNMTGWVSGTNSESSFIGGSLCAERAAAVQLRELPASIQVTAVYLCSDLLEIPITPGVLCREYLLSCVSPDIPVWMATADLSTIRSSTLRELYPYPNMYENIKRDINPVSAGIRSLCVCTRASCLFYRRLSDPTISKHRACAQQMWDKEGQQMGTPPSPEICQDPCSRGLFREE